MAMMVAAKRVFSQFYLATNPGPMATLLPLPEEDPAGALLSRIR